MLGGRNSGAFELFAPRADETPVVVEVPHASTFVPARFLAPIAAPAVALGRDADLLVDELYASAPDHGASLLVARVSRYVIDLNRSEADVDAEVVEPSRSGARYNHGLIWKATSDGERALARPLTSVELEERLDAIYRPYHAALRAELERKRAKFGVVVLLAAHSMPSFARPRAGDGTNASPSTTGVARADVVPGTRGRTSADARVIDVVDELARARGWTVRHDEPYAGGYSTQHYGRPRDRVHALQVELARRLYLDEGALRPVPGRFEAARDFCISLVRRIGEVARRL